MRCTKNLDDRERFNLNNPGGHPTFAQGSLEGRMLQADPMGHILFSAVKESIIHAA